MVAVIILGFMLGSIQLRTGNAQGFKDITVGKMIEDFELHVIRRITDVERGMVVLGYFLEHDYWGLGNYYSVVIAPIPSNLFPDKPPVDTGRYLASIGWGWEVSPPVPKYSIASTSWPDRFLAGYMSFGIFGYFLLSGISGFFYGAVFRVVREMNYTPIALFLFSKIALFGIMPLSPINIVQFLTFLLLITIIGLLFRAFYFPFNRRTV